MSGRVEDEDGDRYIQGWMVREMIARRANRTYYVTDLGIKPRLPPMLRETPVRLLAGSLRLAGS